MYLFRSEKDRVLYCMCTEIDDTPILHNVTMQVATKGLTGSMRGD